MTREGIDMSAPQSAKARHFGVLATLLLAAVCGCTTPTYFRNWREPWTDKPPIGEVGKVEAIWFGLDEKPDQQNRGYPTVVVKGRVFLSTGTLEDALREGEGRLTIELYDDQQSAGAAQPREVWMISADNLSKVFAKDAVGWGYSLILPWNNYHPSIKKVNLGVCYTGADGKDIWSKRTTMIVNDQNAAPLEITQKKEDHKPPPTTTPVVLPPQPR